MKKPPFEAAFDNLECDLSEMGLTHACKVYERYTGSRPEILWINEADFEYAVQLLDVVLEFNGLRLAIDSGYDQDAWSVGTLISKGYGSVGA